MGNDDEWEATMNPFVEKMAKLQKEWYNKHGKPTKHGKQFDQELSHAPEWSFIKQWSTPINDSSLEQISPRGLTDSEKLGNYIYESYPDLFPPHNHHKDKKSSHCSGSLDHDECHDEPTHPPSKNPKNKKPITPFKVWTASSERDIDTSKKHSSVVLSQGINPLRKEMATMEKMERVMVKM